ncbi:uncharacterized protein LOC101892289 [Musca domestica]|uniref:Uncharacterized protein LOC101892289 n=1 Tax=Musca domestica TaxID=7370 RepID=A0ABM3UZP8_MUSDO|nr:uncharacterized protein LOC101892289 [Musca domestica]
MINSVNTLEFLKPNLLGMDKVGSTNSTARTHHHQLFGHTATRNFYNIVGGADHQVAHEEPNQERVKVQLLQNHKKLQNNDCGINIFDLINTSKYKIMDDADGVCPQQQEQEEGEIQNERETDADLETKSAFNLDLNKQKIYRNNNNNNKSSPTPETNNNDLFFKQNLQQNGFINKQPQHQPQQKTMMVLLPRRTEDQEHAHRRIEIVHNYAKLKSYEDESSESQSPNGSRNSSYLDDEEDDDDEDDEEDYEVDDDNNDADYDAEEDEMIDLDGVYEDIFKRRKLPKLTKQTSMDAGAFRMVEKPKSGNSNNKRCNSFSAPPQKLQTATKDQKSDEDVDIHVDVDVETVDHAADVQNRPITATPANCGISSDDAVISKPDHHARRPMNAFLIFCKRHRAIVKDRYKNLENRAITKILGDWWASLDVSDKKCFTNLAQQNKDAFFSANPNFKWYKLPAPPLRTLNTRPNAVGDGIGDMLEQDDAINHQHMTVVNNTTTTTTPVPVVNNMTNHRNFFKLADEAQMGDLSQLMQNKSGTQQCALQQALGETSQFIRSYITGNVEEPEIEMQRKHQSLKRPIYNENSFSSNSSEEDALIPKKKSSRSCKGKIYQELINSGQIAAPAIKKSKSMQRVTTESTTQQSSNCFSDYIGHRHSNETTNQMMVNINNNTNASTQLEKQDVFDSNSETANNTSPHDMASFDLEEKIKELPALSLDEYLQRKRNTKKKKKFTTNGKKRSNRGNSSTTGSVQGNKANAMGKGSQNPISTSYGYNILDPRIIQQRRQQQQQAVGSQKRKARKESITRRDVSAIEEEVASLMPLTINGCCYYQEASLPLSSSSSYKNNTKDMNSNPESTSPIIPTATAHPTTGGELQMSKNTSKELLTNNTLNDNTSSTSDLLILAEVAANRTE